MNTKLLKISLQLISKYRSYFFESTSQSAQLNPKISFLTSENTIACFEKALSKYLSGGGSREPYVLFEDNLSLDYFLVKKSILKGIESVFLKYYSEDVQKAWIDFLNQEMVLHGQIVRKFQEQFLVDRTLTGINIEKIIENVITQKLGYIIEKNSVVVTEYTDQKAKEILKIAIDKEADQIFNEIQDAENK